MVEYSVDGYARRQFLWKWSSEKLNILLRGILFNSGI
jgi:hypothetical protein